MVGQDPAQLLGHSAIEGTHPGLDVCHCDAGHRARERPGQRGVGVAVDDQHIRAGIGEERLERGKHPRRLRSIGTAADPEVAVRRGNAQFGEEDGGERVVVVLPSVDQDLFVLAPKHGRDCRRLDELGAVANDGDDLHGLSSSERIRSRTCSAMRDVTGPTPSKS